MSHMFLSQLGLNALSGFVLSSASHDEQGKRYEYSDGLLLACTLPHSDGTQWVKQWPGHVAAPDLRHLAVVAQRHWDREHTIQEETGVAE